MRGRQPQAKRVFSRCRRVLASYSGESPVKRVAILLKFNTIRRWRQRRFATRERGAWLEKEGDEVIHRGISQRSFARSFTIADDVKVNGAELKDGLLTISCEKIIPEIKKKRLIEIK